MHRFLCQEINPQKHTASITDKREIHHIKNVLRLKSGDKVIVFDGQGKQANGTLRQVKSTAVTVGIGSITENNQGQSTIILACAIPKKAKFETIIEKCTELGIDEIIPLQTQRTEVLIKKDKLSQKLARYQTVAVNAAKQSQRTAIPKIWPPAKFADALTVARSADLSLIPCLFGKRKNVVEILQKTTPKPKKIVFFIGPEGDFTPQEIKQALEAGCIPVTLGSTTLKVDTAAIAVCALTNFYANT